MKKKLLCLISLLFILVPCFFILTACGSDEVSYNLEVKAVVVDDSGAYVKDLDLSSELVDESVSKTEFEALSGEHIGGNGFLLRAPIKLRYCFIGWFDDKGDRISVYHDQWWNMYDRDCVFEARYTVLKYNINYVYDYEGNKFYNPDGTLVEGANDQNPTEYDSSENVTLQDPGFKYYELQGWHYNDGNTSQRTLTNLPIDERDLPWYENPWEGEKEITIFGDYIPKQVQLTFESANSENLDKILTFSSYDNHRDSVSYSYVEIPHTVDGHVGFTIQRDVNFDDAPDEPVMINANWNKLVIFIEVEEGYKVSEWKISDGEHTYTVSVSANTTDWINHTVGDYINLEGDITIILTIEEA